MRKVCCKRVLKKERERESCGFSLSWVIASPQEGMNERKWNSSAFVEENLV